MAAVVGVVGVSVVEVASEFSCRCAPCTRGVAGGETVETVDTASGSAGTCSRESDALDDADANGVDAALPGVCIDSSAVSKDAVELARDGARIGGGGDLGFAFIAAGTSGTGGGLDELLPRPGGGASDADVRADSKLSFGLLLSAATLVVGDVGSDAGAGAWEAVTGWFASGLRLRCM